MREGPKKLSIVVFLWLSNIIGAWALVSQSPLSLFSGRPQRPRYASAVCFSSSSSSSSSSKEDASETIDSGETIKGNSKKEEAELFLAEARSLREEIAQAARSQEPVTGRDVATPPSPSSKMVSNAGAAFTLPWTLPPLKNVENNIEENPASENEYRLYLDIGREPGTWMDRRWGASGRRIECTLDVRFLPRHGEQGLLASPAGSSSDYAATLEAAPQARLRGGFDRMSCSSGGYHIETNNAKGSAASATAKFSVLVEGKKDGDVEIPAGLLYFALPIFSVGSGKWQLSKKEGVVSVKQTGWNTGWYREESRILGVFRAIPVVEARRRDGF